jgi:peptidoglycan hydrolase CwlO-like protein
MADDRNAALIEELKNVHRELTAVKSSRDHYQNQAGEAVRLVKAKNREIERLRRDLEKARAEIEALKETA